MSFNLKTSRRAFDDVIDRVRALLSDNDPSSDDFFDLMNHVRDFIAVAQDDIRALEETIRSPLTERKDHDAARELYSAVRSDLDRLEASQELLEARAEELMQLEIKSASKERYNAVRSRRDSVVAKFDEAEKRIYWLSAFFSEIVASNLEIDRMNDDLPEDCAPLERAEGLARGFPDRGGYETQASLESFRFIQSILPGIEPGSVEWPLCANYQNDVLNHRRGFTAREAMAHYRKKKGGTN